MDSDVGDVGLSQSVYDISYHILLSPMFCAL